MEAQDPEAPPFPAFGHPPPFAMEGRGEEALWFMEEFPEKIRALNP